ncbi:YdiY family protein [Shewanella sp. 10N.286.48.B5]|uniref:DUF481 domain-containing protein n=1 Tax=Shewanella sp. 10N.286.48.B5 TaxID=1880834 RepID=UPI000CA7A338|nr:DUF481 domain-containing protein [Shewanella sp. 10N.286.48.B5]PMH85139.1 hypothetical protein BCU57_15675 [Shewanella sp. 10N.286.48.B5]
MKKVCIFMSSLLTTSSAWALVPPDYKEPPSDFKAEIEAGMQLNTGNNQSQNFNGRTYLNYDTEKARQEFTFKVYYAADKDSTTAEKYDVFAQSSYKLESGYIFGRGEFTWDDFGSYTKLSTVSTGYGFDLLSNYTQSLSIEVGPGYRYDLPKATDTDLNPAANQDIILRTAAKYNIKLQEYTSLNADLTSEVGEDNNTLTLDVSYRNTFLQDWAFKLGVNVRYTAVVPEDSVKTDTITTFNLLYTFQ